MEEPPEELYLLLRQKYDDARTSRCWLEDAINLSLFILVLAQAADFVRDARRHNKKRSP